MSEPERTHERWIREPIRKPDTTVGRIRLGKSPGHAPPIKLSGPFPRVPLTPLGRVREFLRQHRQMDGGDREQVAQVYHHSGREPARLNTSDLQFLLDSLDAIRDAAYRVGTADSDPLVMTTIHRAALGIAAGIPAPPVGWPPRVDLGPDGTPHPCTHDHDPFEGGGGTRRTRTCVHCQRRCGDVPGGVGVINGAPICSPTETGRPDCYQLVTTVGGHRLHSCDACNTFNTQVDGGSHEDAAA